MTCCNTAESLIQSHDLIILRAEFAKLIGPAHCLNYFIGMAPLVTTPFSSVLERETADVVCIGIKIYLEIFGCFCNDKAWEKSMDKYFNKKKRESEEAFTQQYKVFEIIILRIFFRCCICK